MRLTSDRLVVDIDEPGSHYRGSRFDWTGFITQVTLDGRHTFCVPEPDHEGVNTHGSGLCNEFSGRPQPGYEETPPGERFPKLGVGLLTRPDDGQYQFTYPYQIQPFPLHVSEQSGRASFTIDPVECRGYAARLVKEVAVDDNRLTITYQLENVGSQPIRALEYNHNFLCIDGQPVGPGYRLRSACAFNCQPVPDVLVVHEQELRWRNIPAKSFYCRSQFDAQGEPGWWELVYEPEGVGVREVDSFSWPALGLWGTAQVVSPEAFIAIDLPAGESRSWERAYTFFS